MKLPVLRAPIEQYGLLVFPPMEEIGSLLNRNVAFLHNNSIHVLQRPLARLRELAQAEIRAAVSRFMTRLGLPLSQQSGKGFIVTGHQPELFHPGVWIKNFAAHYLAHKFGIQSLNLIVDSDLVKTTSILLPTADGVRHTAAFDTGPVQVPYEERAVSDDQTFRDFPETVAGLAGQLSWAPILPEFWKDVLAASAHTSLLGESLAMGRHRWEMRYGCHNQEVPISDVCATESFAVFACDLLVNLPRFHRIHNESLDEFRRKHGIRSRHHPVPALAEMDGWRELPFWVWRSDLVRRRRLFAVETIQGWQLGVLEGTVRPLNVLVQRSPQRAVATWRQLPEMGWKVRSRALTTTLFARLFLAELFIHGLGGGIYDELTDTIIQHYYNLTPPTFLILSGTLRLPWPEETTPPVTTHSLHERLRTFGYHPERFFGNDEATTNLLRLEKQELLDRVPQTKLERHERFLALKRCTAAMSSRLEKAKKQVEMEIEQTKVAEQNRLWRQDREYAFCLHSEKDLLTLFTPFLPQIEGRNDAPENDKPGFVKKPGF